MTESPKIRLDQLVHERGLAESRERARRMILAGLVLVGPGRERIDKPGTKIPGDAELAIKGEVCPYVSRGGFKLERALERFGSQALDGIRALDIGASTGGFTDCLLQRGAAEVWTLDSGRGQLHQKLRDDPRVHDREQANARHLTPDWLGGNRVDLIVIDVSFISLRLILPPLPAVLSEGGRLIALVKPQFEAGREQVGKGGVVRERKVHREVLEKICDFALHEGWHITGLCPSPIKGPAGNIEFLIALERGSTPEGQKPENAIETALNEAYNETQESS